MDGFDFSVVSNYKQRHYERISRKKTKRHALLEERHDLLDVKRYEQKGREHMICDEPIVEQTSDHPLDLDNLHPQFDQQSIPMDSVAFTDERANEPENCKLYK